MARRKKILIIMLHNWDKKDRGINILLLYFVSFPFRTATVILEQNNYSFPSLAPKALKNKVVSPCEMQPSAFLIQMKKGKMSGNEDMPNSGSFCTYSKGHFVVYH